MTDAEPYDEWRRWTDQACAALDVDPAAVDIPTIHDVSRLVAHNVDRPLAPVSTYVMGIAVGAALARGEQIGQAELDALAARIPLAD